MYICQLYNVNLSPGCEKLEISAANVESGAACRRDASSIVVAIGVDATSVMKRKRGMRLGAIAT